MPSVYIQLNNADFVANRLEEIGHTAEKGVVKDALRAGGKIIETAVKGNITSRTGLLQSSTRLRMSRGDRPGRYSVYIGSTASRGTVATRFEKLGRRGYAAGIRSRGKSSDRYRVWYALSVEAGHGIGKGGKSGRVKAHSFARKGFDATVNEAANVIERQIGDGIEQQFTS